VAHTLTTILIHILTLADCCFLGCHTKQSSKSVLMSDNHAASIIRAGIISSSRTLVHF